MSTGIFFSFFYGAMGGALCTILFLTIVFRKAEEVVASLVRTKALKLSEFNAVAKAAAAVPPAKVEALCRVVCFDNEIVGDAIQVRAVLYNKTVAFYRVEEIVKLPDHTQEVRAEKLLGMVNITCVEATSQRISKYHRHVNPNTRYAPVKGKCVILTARENMPLFLEDPAEKLSERIQRAKKERQALTRELRRRVEEIVEGGIDDEQLLADGERGGSTSPSRATGKKKRVKIELPDAEESIMGARCLAIKFSNRRESERWQNLMQSTQQTLQWRDFIHHLPQVDVLNLLTARLFFENTRTSDLRDLLQNKIQDKLGKVSKSLPPHIKGTITLDNLTVGGEVPLISAVSDAIVSPAGAVEFDFDLLYRGGLAISIRFAITYRDIRVPDIIFHVKVLELAGRMRFKVAAPPTDKCWIGGPKPPQLRLEFTQEVASHDGFLNAVMNIMPDMSQVMTNIVRVMLFEDMVLPNMDDFPWPVLSKPHEAHEEPPAAAAEERDDVSVSSIRTTQTNRKRRDGSAQSPRESSAMPESPLSSRCISEKRSSSKPNHYSESPFTNKQANCSFSESSRDSIGKSSSAAKKVKAAPRHNYSSKASSSSVPRNSEEVKSVIRIMDSTLSSSRQFSAASSSSLANRGSTTPGNMKDKAGGREVLHSTHPNTNNNHDAKGTHHQAHVPKLSATLLREHGSAGAKQNPAASTVAPLSPTLSLHSMGEDILASAASTKPTLESAEFAFMSSGGGSVKRTDGNVYRSSGSVSVASSKNRRSK